MFRYFLHLFYNMRCAAEHLAHGFIPFVGFKCEAPTKEKTEEEVLGAINFLKDHGYDVVLEDRDDGFRQDVIAISRAGEMSDMPEMRTNGKALVNGKEVPSGYLLKDGDTVEIIPD